MDPIKTIRKKVIGATVTCIGRSCNLIWIGLKKEGVYDYSAFHVQCLLRIKENNEIVAASNDMYEPLDESNEDFEYDRDTSYFDECVNKWLDRSEHKITDFVLNEDNDFELIFENSKMSFIRTNVNPEIEQWRFIYDLREDVFSHERIDDFHIVYSSRFDVLDSI